jgi:hypothetical protein
VDSDVISASEVGQYVFCPESWRLNQSARRFSDRAFDADGFGARSNPIPVEADTWAQVVDELEALRFGLRLVFGLLIVACLIYELG